MTTLGWWLVTVTLTGRVVSESRSIPNGLLPISPSGPLAFARPVYFALSVCVALS